LSKYDNHKSFQSDFLDRSPGLFATLGYLSRPDIRDWENYYSYQWKPSESQTLLAYGPSIDTVLNCDHESRLQNWSATPGFSVTLPRTTILSVAYQEGYELYDGIGFRERSGKLSLMSSWFSWLDFTGVYSQGSRPNYFPPAGVEPFLGNSNNVSATVTLRPQPHLRLDEIYYYTRLATRQGELPPECVPGATSSPIT